MIRSLAVSSLVLVSVLAVACGGSDASITTSSSSNEKLQLKQDGTATGDGKVCSWQGTSIYASLYGTSSSASVPSYTVGEDFKSLDGCNECQCTAQGIMCTVNACADGGAVACPAIARVCKDGSAPVAGSNCAQTCPEDTQGGACPALAKACPDGSSVGPTGPNCTFPECPTGGKSCSDLTSSALATLTTAVGRDSACEQDSDCIAVGSATSCSPGCSIVIAKAGEADYQATQKQVEGSECASFKSQSCQLEGVACSNIAIIPRCNNKKCGQ